MCKSPTHHDYSPSALQKNMTTKSSKSRPLLLLLCATGITSCYLWYGIIQERVFDIDNNNKEDGDVDTKQSITLFLLATGTFSAFLIAWIWTMVGPMILKSDDNKSNKDAKGKLNHPLIILTSLTYLSAMAASNESLHYVSYPTCVLAKSSKLIPTMLVGWLLDTWRSYRNKDTNSKEMSNNNAKSSVNMLEWVGAILITVGILLFQYIQLNKQSSTGSDSVKEDKPDSPYGLALLVLSLAMDGIMAGCQSTLKRKSSTYRTPSAMDTMLWLNVYATTVLLVASHYTGQLQLGMDMIFSKNRTYIWLLFQLNLSASLGQVFIFLTIHHFSPLTTTTITTTRKFFTILLSVYKFGHVLDIYQWFSIFLVFGGLYLGIAAKLIESKEHADDKKKKIE